MGLVRTRVFLRAWLALFGTVSILHAAPPARPSGATVVTRIEATELPAEAWATASRLLATAIADGGWRLNARPRLRLATDDGTERSIELLAEPAGTLAASIGVDGFVHVDVTGRSVAFRLAPPPDIERAVRAAAAHHVGGASDVTSPMPGAVLAVHVEPGSVVEAGDPIVTLEAMKMEHVVSASGPGTITDVLVRPADQVARGQLLVQLE